MKLEKKVFEKIFSRFIPPKNQWTPVDKALFEPSAFFYNYKEAQKLMFPAIKHSFTQHYTNNQLYHSLCQTNNVKPADIQSQDDILNIR